MNLFRRIRWLDPDVSRFVQRVSNACGCNTGEKLLIKPESGKVTRTSEGASTLTLVNSACVSAQVTRSKKISDAIFFGNEHSRRSKAELLPPNAVNRTPARASRCAHDRNKAVDIRHGIPPGNPPCTPAVRRWCHIRQCTDEHQNHGERKRKPCPHRCIRTPAGAFGT